MKISTEHRDALNEALDETAGYEGDVYVFDVKHIEILRSAVIAMLEDDEQTTTVAPAVDAQPVAWLVTGGKTFVDRAFITEAHADKSIAERKDGARKVPLGRIDAALSQHTGEKDD